jgi:hypothetical protein
MALANGTGFDLQLFVPVTIVVPNLFGNKTYSQNKPLIFRLLP